MFRGGMLLVCAVLVAACNEQFQENGESALGGEEIMTAWSEQDDDAEQSDDAAGPESEPSEPPGPSGQEDEPMQEGHWACPGMRGSWNYCSEFCLCSEGAGDCDDDEDCGPHLYCVHDVGRHYGLHPSVDVCLPRCPDIHLGSWEFCSAECPCDVEQGDCDGDEECALGLSCVDDMGAAYGWDREIDVCLELRE